MLPVMRQHSMSSKSMSAVATGVPTRSQTRQHRKMMHRLEKCAPGSRVVIERCPYSIKCSFSITRC